MNTIFEPSPYHVSIHDLMMNATFQRLADIIQPGSFPEIRDAELFITKHGVILNVDGWNHPSGQVVGTAMYAPDRHGSKTIFGHHYQKLTLYPGTYTPVPFCDRAAIVATYAPGIVTGGLGEPYARYKQMVPQTDLVAHISNRRAFHAFLDTVDHRHPELRSDIKSIGGLLGMEVSNNLTGFTGSPSLGNFTKLHDLDVVFTGTIDENLAIAKAMRSLVQSEPDRRLFEGGKGWNIRFFNDRRTLICSFFCYHNANDAPLRSFNMQATGGELEIEGTVVDDRHTIYMPSVFTVEHAGNSNLNEPALPNPLTVVVYNAASRGDCFAGDRVRIKGQLVRITTPHRSYVAVCIIERNGVRNLTPAWQPYYE